MKTAIGFANFCGRISLVLCAFVVVGQPAFAFDDPPMRVARLNYVQGDVSFQPGGETDWGWAALNRPMTTGDSLWTGDGSRAEMHIGSTAIRVDEQTSVSFLNLDDRTVQIQLNSGTVDVRVRNLYGDDAFEVDTPNLAFTVLRRGDYRFTVDPDGRFTTITLRSGQGQIIGGDQAFLVDGGSQVQVSGTDYISYEIYDLPDRDNFDQWSYYRELREARSRSARYVSPELTGYEDLDQNGIWRMDRNYGPVWVPTHVSRNWAPYRDGHWVWVDPWGWTWVDNAPAGFVTSHYGRWAYLNDSYGRGGWAWVPPRRNGNQQDVYAQRPVYSPALVTFVGDSDSSRNFGNGGRVAWLPLAPGEVYVPAQQTSPTYVTNVNVTNTVVRQTTITNVVNNVVNNNVQSTTYVNQRVAGAVTEVPQATFVNAQPVAQAAVRVAPSAITAAPAVPSAPVAPVRASVMGANQASRASATAVSAPPKPPDAVVSRPVVANVAPPPPPVAFAQKQQALQANPGKPLDPKADQDLRAAAPPPFARVVKTAPPAPEVKPVETAAKKPQPATSPNTTQQVRPPAAGAPPASAGSQQAAQQQLEAEKAKQEAAQQQAAQQAAAAEKAKQLAAQQQMAAEKARQEVAQQQVAAAEKAKQQAAAAERAKQEAAQQAAAAEKARQEVAQQQAAAAEKAKQQAAAAERAKQEAAQQQAEQQQQVAAEKVRQEAAQQRAAQLQAAAEKAKQQAAQQQIAAEKARQEAAQQQAAQQAAARQQVIAEKVRQEAAQQRAAQLQAAAEKAKQEAAQQAAERARQQLPAEQRPQSNPNARPPGGAAPANQPAAANNGPVRVAENVQAAKLISQPKLIYPPSAKAAHIQGTVRVQALIGADGKVKNATVLSGPQPLQAAALENVRQRLYKPTIADGKPVEVETEISIEF